MSTTTTPKTRRRRRIAALAAAAVAAVTITAAITAAATGAGAQARDAHGHAALNERIAGAEARIRALRTDLAAAKADLAQASFKANEAWLLTERNGDRIRDHQHPDAELPARLAQLESRHVLDALEHDRLLRIPAYTAIWSDATARRSYTLSHELPYDLTIELPAAMPGGLTHDPTRLHWPAGTKGTRATILTPPPMTDAVPGQRRIFEIVPTVTYGDHTGEALVHWFGATLRPE